MSEEPRKSSPDAGCVLLVDDEENVLIALQRVLSRRGHQVVAVDNGSTALTLIEEGAHFDIMLTDIRMPGLNGIELAQRVRRHHPDLDVIVMTGYASVETAVEAVKLGASDYLFKPFPDVEIVAATVERVMKRRRLEAELARATGQLRSSQESFASIVERTRDGIMVVDAGGTVRFANSAAGRLQGRPKEELVGHPFVPSSIAPGSPRSPEAPAAPGSPGSPGSPEAPAAPGSSGSPEAPAAPGSPRSPEAPGAPGSPRSPEAPAAPGSPGSPEAPGAPPVPGMPTELELPGDEGEGVTVEVRVEPTDWRGEPALLVMLRDVTARKQAELERAQFEEQLLQAQKMEAIGALASGVAHDFGNTLTAIMGVASYLKAKTEEGDPMGQQIERILSACDRGTELTRQLLHLARRDRVREAPLSINSIVTEVTTLLSRTVPKTIEIRKTLKIDLPELEGDAGQLHQMLLNLGINAADAMPEGGVLTFTTQSARLGPRSAAMIPDLEPGDFVRLQVSDTGEGMDTVTRQRAFEPFFTTKPEGKGTGLGLSTVYNSVRSHGGAVQLDSEVERGTVVTIYLPLRPPRAEG